MATFDIEKKSETEFIVTVVPPKGLVTQHTVLLYPEYYNLLTEGLVTKEELLKLSFEFLLKRESNDSILPSFDLPDISQYFPEYEQEIKKYIEEKNK